MTNGEKIREIFPNINIYEHGSTYSINNEYNFNASWWNAEYKEPTPKNDLAVACVDKAELLKAMDTWDKFGYTTRYGLERLDKDDKGFVPYVKYDDMVNCVKGMPSVTLQEPTALPSVTPIRPKGHWIYTPQQRLVKETDDGGVYRTEYRCSCSECGGDFGFIKNKDAFCKFCGADMRGKEE